MINLFFYCALLFWWLHIAISPLPMLLGSVSLLCFLGYSLWRYIFLASPKSWIGVEASESEKWSIVSRKGIIYDAILREDTHLLPGMIALRFNVPNYFWPVTITLFKDSLMPQDWRRLRALLEWSFSKR